MKINLKVGGKKHSIDFRVSTSRSANIIVMAKTSKDLDTLQQVISDTDGADMGVKEVIRQTIEKKLKLPVEIDYGYMGAGFAFKFDMYSVIQQLK
tara:strand:- start:193 stop:477 length:285 start_codon:yes stop_codon:yes gene_type:complete